MSTTRGYEERHFDAMLIAFHALNVSEHRPKPEQAAAEARVRADAFVAELVKMDLEREAEQCEQKPVDDDHDITHENAERDTEPPRPGPTEAALCYPEAPARQGDFSTDEDHEAAKELAQKQPLL